MLQQMENCVSPPSSVLFPTAMADKNGEPDALAQENEKLERQLAEVTDNVVKAKDTLDKLLNGTITMEDVPEQDTKQLAEIIAMNLSSQYIGETTHEFLSPLLSWSLGFFCHIVSTVSCAFFCSRAPSLFTFSNLSNMKMLVIPNQTRRQVSNITV